MIKNFKEIDELLKKTVATPKKIVVVKAGQKHALQSVFEFARAGYLTPILIDSKETIINILSSIDTENISYEIVDEADDTLAAKKGVELIKNKKADFLMKGQLNTATLLREVVNSKTGIRNNDVLFHLALLDIPNYNKLLGITDGGMLLFPTVEQKKQIISGVTDIFTKLGYEKTKISLLSAAEKVNPKLQSSVEAAEIAEQYKSNTDIIVEGPLSLDISLNKLIAEEKGYTGIIQGDADVLLVPDIVSGNAVSKSFILMANAQMAGLVLGATVPIVLTSRSATEIEKKYSLALALLVSGGK
ncbi:phosphate acyltransferase [Gemella bergeri]|nr:phosphate acyltransferase [Gemella bergeri]